MLFLNNTNPLIAAISKRASKNRETLERTAHHATVFVSVQENVQSELGSFFRFILLEFLIHFQSSISPLPQLHYPWLRNARFRIEGTFRQRVSCLAYRYLESPDRKKKGKKICFSFLLFFPFFNFFPSTSPVLYKIHSSWLLAILPNMPAHCIHPPSLSLPPFPLSSERPPSPDHLSLSRRLVPCKGSFLS